jgi:crotonobetainyl-CoA:carnitine CoA-transferase CaiB-like acyl-CoA transferase
MYLSGDPDRPPVRPGGQHAYLHGSADAAVGALIALYHRHTSGKGQWVDVSIQASLIQVSLHGLPSWDLNQFIEKRTGTGMVLPTGALRRLIWQCKDGAISFNLLGGKASAIKSNEALIDWMKEENFDLGRLATVDWSNFSLARIPPEELESLYAPIEHFFIFHTKHELYKQSRERGILLCPLFDIAEVSCFPQLGARRFWCEAEIAGISKKPKVFRPFARIWDEPTPLRQPIPMPGYHNREVYVKELGLTENELLDLQRRGVI